MKMDYKRFEWRQIKRLMDKAKNVVMFKRYQVIMLYMKGRKREDIAEVVGISSKTINRYIKKFKDGGIENLVPIKPPGRPPLLSEEQETRVYSTITFNTPDEVGFDGIKNWTAKIACLWVLREFGVSYSNNGMLDLFHRLNLSYTRPTYVLEKADPEKQKQFADNFEKLKKNS
jgi:transposase